MSTTAFNGLVDFLCSTLKPYELKQVCEMLGKYIQKYEQPTQKPYTKEELNAMLDEAERRFSEGKGIPGEDVFRELNEEFAKEDEEESLMYANSVVEEELLLEAV